MGNLKSDEINYGDNSISVNYHKTKKAGRVFVEVSLTGKDAKKILQMDKSGSFERFYASKSHAQKIVLPVVKSIVKKNNRGTVEIDYDDFMKLPSDTKLFVTSHGEENIYFQKGGEDYFVKSYQTFYFPTPAWMTAKELKRYL